MEPGGGGGGFYAARGGRRLEKEEGRRGEEEAGWLSVETCQLRVIRPLLLEASRGISDYR